MISGGLNPGSSIILHSFVTIQSTALTDNNFKYKSKNKIMFLIGNETYALVCRNKTNELPTYFDVILF